MSSGGDSDSRRDLKRAASTDSDESFISKKSRSMPGDDAELEPYVRRRKAENDKTKQRLMKLDPEEQDRLRQCINSRERRRMHNLNSALDKLRNTLPHSKTPTSRKLSKINTIVTASEWINQLSEENGLLRSQISDLGGKVPPPLKPNPVKHEMSSSPIPPSPIDRPPSTPRLPMPIRLPNATPQLPAALMAFPQFFPGFPPFLFPHRFPTPNHFAAERFHDLLKEYSRT